MSSTSISPSSTGSRKSAARIAIGGARGLQGFAQGLPEATKDGIFHSVYALVRRDVPDEKVRAAELAPKCMLKADKAAGVITIDSETTLAGIPPQAWTYRLGNRCALEWVLDQYKEKKPKDPTIREKFDTYRFADYKEKVIDLLARVTTVSVQTVRIVEAMKTAPR